MTFYQLKEEHAFPKFKKKKKRKEKDEEHADGQFLLKCGMKVYKT